MIFNIFLILTTYSFGAHVAIVRPFSKKDYNKLTNSFASWNTYLPCSANEITTYDLILSYSQNLNNEFERNFIIPLLIEFKNNYSTYEWSKCFNQLIIHESNLDSSNDIYEAENYITNKKWVSGPNKQFIEISDYIISTNVYDYWILLEMDILIKQTEFLTALNIEIITKQPFIVMGSKYKGDRWDMIMSEVDDDLKSHINGNAVYNHTHPYYDILLQQLHIDQYNDNQNKPYDYRLSQLITEMGTNYKQLYKSDSSIIGNYASTNMLEELFDNEYIIHGAYITEKWTDPLGLVVSDWDIGDIDEFHDLIINGDHPFTDVVYVVPYHKLPKISNYVFHGKLNHIKIKYVSRNNPTQLQNPDYLDSCFHQPDTNYFMTTNTYMRIASPVRISSYNNKSIINYIPYRSFTCLNDIECKEAQYNIQNYLNVNISKIVQNMAILYEKNTYGSASNLNGYCGYWLNKYKHDNLYENSKPNYVPSATGYIAYLETLNLHDIYSYSNLIVKGYRDVFIQHTIPQTNNICYSSNNYLESSIGTIVSKIGYKKHIIPQSVIECINIMDNQYKCNQVSHCWWRPVFNKCIQIQYPIDNYDQQFIGGRRTTILNDVIRYPSSVECPICENCNNNSVWMILTIIFASLLGMIVLLALFGLIGWGIYHFCFGAAASVPVFTTQMLPTSIPNSGMILYHPEPYVFSQAPMLPPLAPLPPLDLPHPSFIPGIIETEVIETTIERVVPSVFV